MRVWENTINSIRRIPERRETGFKYREKNRGK